MTKPNDYATLSKIHSQKAQNLHQKRTIKRKNISKKNEIIREILKRRTFMNVKEGLN